MTQAPAFEPLDHPAMPDPPSLEALAEMARGLSASAEARYAEVLSCLVVRLVGDGPQAQEALDSGAFVLHGITVVMRLARERQAVEFFCDVGLPDPRAREQAFEAALQLNLCRSYPGVLLGVHPESGRLVATTDISVVMLQDDAWCQELMEALTQQVQAIRDSGAIALADERPG